MQLQSEIEIAVSAPRVWAELTRFDRFERAATQAGAVVTRTDARAAPGLGTGWRAEFRARGKDRVLEAEVTEFSAPERLGFTGRVSGLEGALEVTLVPRGDTATRLSAQLTLRARSITARLILQSLRLTQTRANTRFRSAVRKLARRIERRHAAEIA